MSSYRPINNLPCIEKIVEEHISIHLNQYLTKNNLIHPHHHGGRRGHSTVSALLQITDKLNKGYDRHMISVALITDLSAAYDTVDHMILLQKLEHYGIRGSENLLFRNYLSKRKQYVQIDTYKSDILPSPDCSVIQGGKLSGTLYNIYTNEIPLLQKYMKMDQNNPFIIKNVKKYNKIEHLTVNFVDDSTNVITFNDTNHIKSYLTDYYNIINDFYSANKLKINADKTKILINNIPKFNTLLKNFYFMANGYTIKPSNTIKILGVYLRNDLKIDTQIGRLCAELHNRLYQLKKLTKFTSFSTRNIFIKSYVIGKLLYAMPLYMSCNALNLEKLHKLLMTAARTSIGSYCFKKSKIYILNKCNLLNIKILILFATLSFFYKLNLRKQPQAILELYNKPNIREKLRKYRPIYMPKSKFVENGCLYRGAKLFDSLPSEYKILTADKFQKTLKGYLAERDIFDTHD